RRCFLSAFFSDLAAAFAAFSSALEDLERADDDDVAILAVYGAGRTRETPADRRPPTGGASRGQPAAEPVRASMACRYSVPARYDERTNGPDITPRKPIDSASL